MPTSCCRCCSFCCHSPKLTPVTTPCPPTMLNAFVSRDRFISFLQLIDTFSMLLSQTFFFSFRCCPKRGINIHFAVAQIRFRSVFFSLNIYDHKIKRASTLFTPAFQSKLSWVVRLHFVQQWFNLICGESSTKLF